jgi:DNA modification methylase
MKTPEIKNRIKELKYIKASELIPNRDNWRTHPEKQQKAMRAILQEIGYAGALLARETPEGTTLIDGHLRAETTPDELVPVLILDVTELEAKKILLTFDPLSAMAEFDATAFNKLTQDIKFDTKALNDLLETVPKTTTPSIDKADELQKIWNTELGDLYTIKGKAGTHKILCGDSTKSEDVNRLFQDKQCDLLLTDPPYNVAYNVNSIQTRTAEHGGKRRDGMTLGNDNMTDEQYTEFLKKSIGLAKQHLKPGCSFYCWYGETTILQVLTAFKEIGLDVRQHLIWKKNTITFSRQDHHWIHETCLYGWIDADADYIAQFDRAIYGWKDGKAHIWLGDRKTSSVFEIKKPASSEQHPTMKPIELFEQQILNSCVMGGIIYDPFLGSGTTLLAAEKQGRVTYGIELLPKFTAVILQRAKDYGLNPIKV